MQIDPWPVVAKVLFSLPTEQFADILTGVGLEIDYIVSGPERLPALRREIYIARTRAAYSKLSIGNKESISHRITKELRLRFPNFVQQLDADLRTIGLVYQPNGFAEIPTSESTNFIEDQLKLLAEILTAAANEDDIDTARQRFWRWQDRTQTLLKDRVGMQAAKEFEDLGVVSITLTDLQNLTMEANKYVGFLVALKEDLDAHPRPASSPSESPPLEESALERILLILKRFHTVARELQRRRENRETIKLEDEYDVQDLLRALLKIFFDDVRPEEWTPSYAGKSSKVDFFLKPEGIVIEVKTTMRGLDAKEIGDQLIIDIERYRQMVGYRVLICFVYDPEHRITNPVGFEQDLSRSEGDLVVKVVVLPKSF
jgi:hypothetical protein